MSNTNTTTRSGAQKAAAEVHLNNYNSARQRGATHDQAFKHASNATLRFWSWLIALGVIAAVFALFWLMPLQASANDGNAFTYLPYVARSRPEPTVCPRICIPTPPYVPPTPYPTKTPFINEPPQPVSVNWSSKGG